VNQDYAVAANSGGVLASFQPMGQIQLDPIDDTEINGDRSLLLTLTPNPMLSVVPFLVTVNESVVIIEDDDALGELWGRNRSMCVCV
jgi:hypothetical protein